MSVRMVGYELVARVTALLEVPRRALWYALFGFARACGGVLQQELLRGACTPQVRLASDACTGRRDSSCDLNVSRGVTMRN